MLNLPPKFAVIEHLDIKELKLELKRAATKGRWEQRSREEKEDEDEVKKRIPEKKRKRR